MSTLRGETIIQEPTEESKNRLKNYLDLAGVILVALNREGNITLLNKKGYEILHYEEGELIGKNWFDVCIPKENQEELKNVFKAIINGDVEPFEYYNNPIINKRGDVRMISWHNALLYDDDGNIVASLSSGEDITDLKETEEKLRESQEHLLNLFNSIPIGIHMYHLYEDGRLVFIGANPAADKILNVDNMQFVGKTIEEAFPPLAETEIPDRYREAAAEGKDWKTNRFDYEHGEIKGAFEVHAFQVSPMYMVATFTDTLERIKKEEEFKKTIKTLEKKVEELTKQL
ncbi:MAG: PAS domain-containing protein [Candidatus Thorarchaeota archaeon]